MADQYIIVFMLIQRTRVPTYTCSLIEPVGFPLKSPSNFVLLDEIQVRANFPRYQTLLDNAQVKTSLSTCGNFYVDEFPQVNVLMEIP